jgi:hypothetical protein
MTKYDKPKLVDLSAMEWEAGAGQTSCNVGSADTTGCVEQNPTGGCTITTDATDCKGTGEVGCKVTG